MEVVNVEAENYDTEDIDFSFNEDTRTEPTLNSEDTRTEPTTKRLKTSSSSSSSGGGNTKKYEGIIGKLNDLQKSVKVEDACDHFGKYVADKLRTLSGARQVLAEQELQNVLTKHIIEEMSSKDTV